MRIRPVQIGDAADWERMRQSLWPGSAGEHAGEIAAYFAGNRRNPEELLVAADEAGRVVGFVELSIRPYAEGCSSGRAAYLEGWWVEESVRRQGIGAALVEAAEEWGRAQGCTEFPSDTDLDNVGSAAAHRALGFAEVGRTVCFRKAL